LRRKLIPNAPLSISHDAMKQNLSLTDIPPFNHCIHLKEETIQNTTFMDYPTCIKRQHIPNIPPPELYHMPEKTAYLEYHSPELYILYAKIAYPKYPSPKLYYMPKKTS
jgi:hypothetical protein